MRPCLSLPTLGVLALAFSCNCSDPGGPDAGHVNHAPVAVAAGGPAVDPGVDLILDGRGSSDPDGDPLTYRWTLVGQPDGGLATVSGEATARPTFRAARKGLYRVRLVVSDGTLDSAPSDLELTARNRAPVADAGGPVAVWPGQVAAFDGRGSSDPDGDALAYRWSLASQPDGGDAALTLPAPGTAEVVASVPGRYAVQLLVDDGAAVGAPAMVELTVRQPNRPPEARIASAAVLPLGVVQLDGTGSTDPDGDPLTYRWSLLDGGGRILDPGAGLTTLAVDLPGTTTVLLTVQDGDAGSRASRSLSFAAPCQALLDLGLSAGDGVYRTTLGAGGGEPLPVLCDQTTEGGGWTLLYKKSAGTTPNAYGLWLSDGGFNAGDAGLLSRDRSGDDYANPLVTRAWPAFAQARVELVVDGGVVKFLEFDAGGSTPTTWFVPSRHTSASWTDLPTSDSWELNAATGHFFSLYGSVGLRTWYLNQTWPGCTGDLGWMMVSQASACPWDAHSDSAVILYAPGDTIGLVPGPQFGRADALLVFGR